MKRLLFGILSFDIVICLVFGYWDLVLKKSIDYRNNAYIRNGMK
jgi:hypothetical protein